ncbi:MAG: hypothetical protein ABFD65_06800, partial [Candidatus Polarisedimenticolia bacterium]
MAFDPRAAAAASGTVGDEAHGVRVGARGEAGRLFGVSIAVPEGTPCALRVNPVGAPLELAGDEAAAAARLALEAAAEQRTPAGGVAEIERALAPPAGQAFV